MYIDNCSVLNVQTDLVDNILFDENNIYVFKKFSKEKDFIDTWDDVQSYVAGNIQANLKEYSLSDNLAWNIYLLFLISFDIEKKVINEIESNKFCCKKYIVKVLNLDDDIIIKNTIMAQIPLFAEFEIGDTQASASNDTIIKRKIFLQSNKSPLAKKFSETLNIEQILDSNGIDQFVDSLIQEGVII